MRNLYILFFLTFVFSCSSNPEKSNKYSKPQKVIVSGKIRNVNLKKELEFIIPNPGRPYQEVIAKTDSAGNFKASFEVYNPTDILVRSKSSFYILVHPGDSIFMSFDGNAETKLEVLESLKFKGKNKTQNQNIASFQSNYYSSDLIKDKARNDYAIKNYDTPDYLKYLDTLRSKLNDIVFEFNGEFTPNNETKLWVELFSDQYYFSNLGTYPMYHRLDNNLSRDDWDVPKSYYDKLLDRFPLNKSMFICSSALTRFTNQFLFFYSIKNAAREENYKKKIKEYLNTEGLFEISDSLNIQGIVKYTPDSLARQLVLSEYIHQDFDKSEIDAFENNRDLVESIIKEPFIIEPMVERYLKLKSALENPKISSDAILKNVSNSSAGQIMDSVLKSNKGKIIYIDFWATWCGPCIAEFPNSKKIMKEFENQDVEFVYLCIDSEEELWKAKLDELEMEGQHYFLSKEQSKDIMKAYDFSGIPFYVLIDKGGVITEKGNFLVPMVAKKSILKMLD